MRVGSIGMLFVLLVALMTACVGPIGRAEQRNWVKKMNKVFKDDEFTYEGPAQGEYGQYSNLAVVHSKKYPDALLYVKEKDGELSTNYNTIRYHDEAVEYFEEYFDGEFDCDEYEITFWAHNQYTPLEDISAEKYIKKYVTCNEVSIYLIREDKTFPFEEEMSDKMIEIAKDRDEVCDLTVFCLEEMTDNPVIDSVCYYKLYMDRRGHVKYVRVSNHEPEKESHYVVEDVHW